MGKITSNRSEANQVQGAPLVLYHFFSLRAFSWLLTITSVQKRSQHWNRFITDVKSISKVIFIIYSNLKMFKTNLAISGEELKSPSWTGLFKKKDVY